MDDDRNAEKLREIAKSLRMDDAWNEANWLDAAADEIERLRAEIERLRKRSDTLAKIEAASASGVGWKPRDT